MNELEELLKQQEEITRKIDALRNERGLTFCTETAKLSFQEKKYYRAYVCAWTLKLNVCEYLSEQEKKERDRLTEGRLTSSTKTNYSKKYATIAGANTLEEMSEKIFDIVSELNELRREIMEKTGK